MNRLAIADSEGINFGDLPPHIDALLQEGVVVYRKDRPAAQAIFARALSTAPEILPTYLCLYKIHTYQGHLEDAQQVAEAGLVEAARQAGWSADWSQWSPTPAPFDGASRFALYTLKALAFIQLRRNNRSDAEAMLTVLRAVDPAGLVGWPVIAALAAGVQTDDDRPPSNMSEHRLRPVTTIAGYGCQST